MPKGKGTYGGKIGRPKKRTMQPKFGGSGAWKKPKFKRTKISKIVK